MKWGTWPEVKLVTDLHGHCLLLNKLVILLQVQTKTPHLIVRSEWVDKSV
jgi:hypothetical protein